MQECNDRHIDASKVDNPCLAGSTTAENAPPIQVLPLALQAQVPKVNPVQDVIPEARTDVEPWAARRDALIPPQTASQLAAVASQLQVALADVQTDSGLNTRPPTAVAPETSAERKQTAALHGGIQEEASFGQPTSEPTQLPLLQSGGGTIILPHKILRWPISIKNLLLRTARMVAIAALLGVLLHRLLLLPCGLALDRFRSTYSSAQVVSEIQNRIRADRRLQMTRVQVRASNGIITLSGDVGSSAVRVDAVQNATQIKVSGL